MVDWIFACRRGCYILVLAARRSAADRASAEQSRSAAGVDVCTRVWVCAYICCRLVVSAESSKLSMHACSLLYAALGVLLRLMSVLDGGVCMAAGMTAD